MIRFFGIAAPAIALVAGAATLRPASPTVPQQGVDTTVIIRSSGPTLEYLPSRLALKQGTRVRVRYINDGSLPHNIVFPKTEDDIDPLATAAMQADETDYIPLDMKGRMLAYSKLVKPSETAEITFVVPPPGEYWFVCLYPGHKGNMLGTLRSLR